MMTRNLIRAAVIGAALLSSVGCSEKLKGEFLPNQRPEVNLTYAPASSSSPYFYSYRFQWFGSDVDGRVEYFIYAVDPPSAPGTDTAWVSTTLFDTRIEFRSDVADTSGTVGRAIAFHTFVIKAVDNRGLESAPEIRSFFTYTAAPTVIINSPIPTAVAEAQLAPTVRISWTGTDPDGLTSREPVKYKYTLLTSSSEFPYELALSNPDSLRRYYQPDFSEWDSVPGNVTSAQYLNLTPGSRYIFAVVAFDEAGAYSPIFTLSNNMLRFRVGLAQNLGPKIRFFSNFFDFTYPSGGYSTDPLREVPLQILPNAAISINWSATPSTGATMRSYRWRLNGDLSDETPRENEDDIGRWSFPSLLTQTARLGPFDPGETHRLYVEAEDSNGIKSLGIVRIEVLSFEGSFSEDLLIVDDTRLAGDQYIGSCARLPVGAWPTAAELDTFLYARGGFPWRCYPAGTMSTPGLFAGYRFDTTGTTPVPLPFATLAKYKRVIWIVDAVSALEGGGFFGGSDDKSTSLRAMQFAGQINTLAAYVDQGGEVWLVGGGTVHAATAYVNGNLSSSGFISRYAKWRSSFTELKTLAFITRSIPPPAPGQPDYSKLPPTISLKTSFTDPFPPGRPGQPLSVYYKSTADIEYLSSPNVVTEDIDPDPEVENIVSVLDTLYTASGILLPPTSKNTVMTHYRGSESPRFLVTGFDIWSFRRDQMVQLVDFVLQDVWGLTRSSPLTAPGPGSPYGPRPGLIHRPVLEGGEAAAVTAERDLGAR